MTARFIAAVALRFEDDAILAHGTNSTFGQCLTYALRNFWLIVRVGPAQAREGLNL